MQPYWWAVTVLSMYNYSSGAISLTRFRNWLKFLIWYLSSSILQCHVRVHHLLPVSNTSWKEKTCSMMLTWSRKTCNAQGHVIQDGKIHSHHCCAGLNEPLNQFKQQSKILSIIRHHIDDEIQPQISAGRTHCCDIFFDRDSEELYSTPYGYVHFWTNYYCSFVSPF